MKKIIYSIVTALILSVILSVLIPKLLFKGDARWTYQNDAARVDVMFSGHLKKGRVEAEGTDIQVLQPTWLSNENYQGTCVLIPVSYQNKRCQIKLTPRAEEWGEDAILVLELKCREFQHRGKRRPAWVCFQNITLNGQLVAAEKVVWHNTPFVLKYPPHSASGITLEFDVRKPLAASDISFVSLLVVFSVFLLLGLFSAPLRRVADRVITFTNRKDIVKVLKDGYLHIDPVYRRSFWIIFGMLCCAFGLHTIWYMWGNHDWVFVDGTPHHWNAHAFAGRYMSPAVKALLSKGIYLPLIYDIITFVILSLNAVLLCKCWRLERRVICYVLCGLVLTAQPFTLSMMYFVNNLPEVFIGVTCALVALLVSEKIALIRGSKGRKIVYSLIAIVMVNFALAMYPVVTSTIAVVFVGRLLIWAFDWDGSRQQLKAYMRPFIISASNIVLGTALYKMIISFVFPPIRFYNTEMLPLAQMPERLCVLLKQSLLQLNEYNMPFLSQWTLWIFLGFSLILVFYICCTGNLGQKVVRLFLLFGALFSTQTAMIIAKTHLIDGRVDLFGLVFFEVLVMVSVIMRLRKLHNIVVIAGTCVIFSAVLNDWDCLRVWKHGFDAEKMLWNRVLARLEAQKDFDPARKYDCVQIGSSISMRPRYYTQGREKHALYMLDMSYDASFDQFRAHQFYYPTRFRGKHFSSGKRDTEKDILDYETRLRRLYQAGVLQKAEVWPKPKGLIVWKDIILFVTDGKELNNVRTRLGRELGREQIQHD